MRLADVWLEAAAMVDAAAAVAEAHAAHLADEYRTTVAMHALAYLDDLADAFRERATHDRRAIDFDDEVTGVWVDGLSSLPTSDQTDPDVVVDVLDDGPTQPS